MPTDKIIFKKEISKDDRISTTLTDITFEDEGHRLIVSKKNFPDNELRSFELNIEVILTRCQEFRTAINNRKVRWMEEPKNSPNGLILINPNQDTITMTIEYFVKNFVILTEEAESEKPASAAQEPIEIWKKIWSRVKNEQHELWKKQQETLLKERQKQNRKESQERRKKQREDPNK